jgi:PadR family transcriptional regulator PadR
MDSLVTARTALLQALAVPGYGLALIARLAQATRGRVRLRPGSVYPALAALQRDGLVRSTFVRPSSGAGRPRTCYELTPAGVAAAAAERGALRGLLRAAARPPASGELLRMRERIARCGQVSDSLCALRTSMLARRDRA